MYGFHGCTDEEHNEEHRRHSIDAGNYHHSLAEMYNDDTFPPVLALQEMITPERLAWARAPTADQW